MALRSSLCSAFCNSCSSTSPLPLPTLSSSRSAWSSSSSCLLATISSCSLLTSLFFWPSSRYHSPIASPPSSSRSNCSSSTPRSSTPWHSTSSSSSSRWISCAFLALLLRACRSAFLPSLVRLFSSRSIMCRGNPFLFSSFSFTSTSCPVNSSSSSEKLSSLACGGWLPSLILLERGTGGVEG